MSTLFLLAISATHASTTFGFAAADSDQQNFSDSGEFYDYSASFLLHGGTASVGLTIGAAKTIHVGAGELSGSAYNDGGSAYPDFFNGEPLPHALSLTGTAGTVTQTLPQTDDLKTVQTDSGGFHSTQTVDVHAGPTVTFDMGTQGRVDVTPQEYTYSANSTNGDSANPPGPKFAYTLLLRAPAVSPSGITVSPSSVTSPASATGTVTLSKPAPDAQAVVLTSSKPAVASVPASVSFAAGQQTATFPIATYSVDADTAVTISAKAGGVTKSTTLTVKAHPKTSISYTIPSFSDSDNESDADAEFSATGGSGTVKLAQDVPYTVNIGKYDATASADYLASAGVGGTMSRAVKLESQTQALLQDYSVTVYTDSESDTVVHASVSDSPTLVYDLGSKGRVELKATGYGKSDTFSVPASYTFTLRAPNTPSSLLVSPDKVYGGAETFGRITLAKGAGIGGQTVALQTSDPALATVPASIVVPAGIKSVTFPITTSAADEDAAVTVTAVSGGVSKTASLSVLARYAFSGTVKSGSAGLSGVLVSASSTGTFTLTSTAVNNQAIPDNSTAGLSTTIKPKGAGTISGLVVGVDITHPRIGDLRVTLKGPDGTSAVLYDQSGGTQVNLQTSYPVLRTPVNSLSAFNGKAVQGTWTLLVQDLATGNVGTLNGWNLTFTYGGTVTGSGTTGSDGTYTVSDLKEGTYTATPTKSGKTFTPSSRSVSVGPGVVDPNPGGIDFAAH